MIAATVNIETDYSANLAVINSWKYAHKFNGLVISPFVKKKIVETARESILKNSGTQDETVTFIDKKTGKQVGEQFQLKYEGGSKAGGTISVPEADPNSLILVHNPGNSSPFSFDDFYLLNKFPEVKAILAVGHNGTVYKMSVGKGKRLDLSDKMRYNDFEREFHRTYSQKTGDLIALERYCAELGWRFEYA